MFDPFSSKTNESSLRPFAFLSADKPTSTQAKDLVSLRAPPPLPIMANKNQQHSHNFIFPIQTTILNPRTTTTSNNQQLEKILLSKQNFEKNETLIVDPFLISNSDNSHKKANSDLDLLGDP
jgi:hypothetical protein